MEKEESIFYYEEKEPDARGFSTFLEVGVLDNKIISATLDGYNFDENNPYGNYKTLSDKYNDEMFAESGTYYRDAAEQLEEEIVEGKYPLSHVKGARFLSADANELLTRIKEKHNLELF